MAILNTQVIESIDSQDLDQIPTKQLVRNFGQGDDFIQFKVLDQERNQLLNDGGFSEYTEYYDTPGTKGDTKITSIDINYEQVLRDYGYTSGTYITQFSFYRRLIDRDTPSFAISEISPSRTEVRIVPRGIEQIDFETVISNVNSLLGSSPFVRDINLVTENHTVLLLNAILSRDKTGLLKLYSPLPFSLSVGSTFNILEEIINPLEVTVQLDRVKEKATGIDIGPPNFSLSTDDIFTVPSGQKTFDKLLNNGSVSSSFNRVQSLLSGSNVQLDLEFDNIDTPSGYHFENFIHFSSATERLSNFKYKLELLETYSSSIAKLDNITGGVANSTFVTENRTILEDKQNRLIQGFDYYERYLYYENGPYAWPKTNTTLPFINAKTDSAAANSWFGAPVNDSTNSYYGGQMLSASKFDEYNQYNLVNTIPPHIKDNQQNDKYVLFVEMIAQHFDGIWAYMDSITDINEAYSGLKDGISKDLVLNQLTSRGISAYDQFSNASLYEYLIGDDGSETFKYNPTDGSTLISASNAPIPKGDIAKEVWKRLYHNSSYLLKTKGTERGLKALIACYGIPESVLHVKEYGGPTVDKTGFRTFSYQKESRMVSNESISTATSHDGILRYQYPFNQITWDGSNGGADDINKCFQVRFLPDSNYKEEHQSIFTLRGNNDSDRPDIGVLISQSLDQSLYNSESFAHLIIVSGSGTALPSIQTVASSGLFPFYNGEPWNITLIVDSGSSDNITAYATQATFNKNIFVASCSIDGTPYIKHPNVGTDYLLVASAEKENQFQGNSANSGLVPYTASIQEFRVWNEVLSEDTIVTQSLSPFNYNGNTISSSYEKLVYRHPLGSTNTTNWVVGGAYANRDQFNHAPDLDLVTPLPLSYITFTPGKTVFLEETHHLTTPDTVGSGMVSDKVRFDNGTFDDNFLDPFISVETSPQDRQPLDYSDLGVFFSPTFEINEDIIYTLGGFRMDDYIGDPQHYTSGSYPDLKTLKDIYFQKVDRKPLGIPDYIRTIQFFDHTLFKMIKEFVPAKVNLKTGLVIEPHYLERTKVAGTNVDYEQLTEHLIAPSGMSGSLSSTYEEEHDVVIDVPDYILSGSYSTATENVAQVSKKSRYYLLR